jgi:hypothetical protein
MGEKAKKHIKIKRFQNVHFYTPFESPFQGEHKSLIGFTAELYDEMFGVKLVKN